MTMGELQVGHIMNWKTRSIIRSEIKKRVESGESKSTVYGDLTKQYGHEAIIMRILNDLPSYELRKKVNSVHYILVVLLIGITLIKAAFAVMGLWGDWEGPYFWLISTLVLQLLILWGVINYTRLFYLFAAIYGVFQVFDYSVAVTLDSLSEIMCTAITVIWIIAIGFSIYLYFKLHEKIISSSN
jgi:hypothetical protein